MVTFAFARRKGGKWYTWIPLTGTYTLTDADGKRIENYKRVQLGNIWFYYFDLQYKDFYVSMRDWSNRTRKRTGHSPDRKKCGQSNNRKQQSLIFALEGKNS